MKREILFRGKTIRTRFGGGKWIEGFFVMSCAGRGEMEPAIITGTEKGCFMTEFVDLATVGQFTGLCDKNGFTKIFEGDIIRLDGTIGGNIYEEKELLKDTTNLIVKGMGTSSWATTEQEAIMRGCHYAE